MSTNQQLPLQLENKPLETTDWAEGPPPSEGWWIASRYGQSERPRRFYSKDIGWSRPVYEGESDEIALSLQRDTRAVEPEEIRWKGLTAPHPDGYSYPLTPIK